VWGALSGQESGAAARLFPFFKQCCGDAPDPRVEGCNVILPEWLMKSGVFSGWSMEGVNIE